MIIQLPLPFHFLQSRIPHNSACPSTSEITPVSHPSRKITCFAAAELPFTSVFFVALHQFNPATLQLHAGGKLVTMTDLQ
jgi:hypothetical protein